MKKLGMAAVMGLALVACDNRPANSAAPADPTVKAGFAPGLGHDDYETICLGGSSYVRHKKDTGALAIMLDGSGKPIQCHT